MFKEKSVSQIFKKEKKEKEHNKENLSEKIEKKIEIYKEGKENKIIEIDEELRNAIVDYVCDNLYAYNKIKTEGLKEGEKLLLYFYKEDLYLTALEGEGKEPHAWSIKNEEIINKIKEFISDEKEEDFEE